MALRRFVVASAAAALAVGLGSGLAACGKDSTPVRPASGEQTTEAPPPTDTTPAAPLRTGERFLRLAMPHTYTPVPPNGGTDEYRCFLVDPHLTTSTFLTGSQFLPQNAKVVHHAILFRVPPDQVAQARSLDAA